MITQLRVCVLAGVLLASGADSATWKEDVRGWYIGVDESVGNGCYMLAFFDGDTFLRVGFDPRYPSLDFVVGDEDWRSIEEGKVYQIEVQFGRRSPWTGEAVGFVWDDGDRSLIFSILEVDERMFLFIDELMKMQSVSVRYDGKIIASLSLKGTFAATEELMNCQLNMTGGLQGTGEDPFGGSTGSDADPFH